MNLRQIYKGLKWLELLTSNQRIRKEAYSGVLETSMMEAQQLQQNRLC
jgi:hypothetical protein